MLINNLLNIDWRKINIFDILKGCSEHFLSDYYSREQSYSQIVKYRLKICSQCPIYNQGYCDASKSAINIATNQSINGCGCFMQCKSALKSASCPRSLWLPVQ